MRAPVFAMLLALGHGAAMAEGIAFVSGADARPAANEVVIDARPLAECRRASLPGARCLPADEFLGPHRRLAGEREILWLLGTAGLDGSEAVLVAGLDATERDFLAGLLHLAGQRAVRVLAEPLPRLLAGRADAAPGNERGIVRAAVYTAPMRDRGLMLKPELARVLAAGAVVPLDARDEREYWGETVRGARGGHLPGAVRLAPAANPPILPAAGDAVVYAHDARDGIAAYARLLAWAPALRVYAGGWAEWAADATLPVDAASYPDYANQMPAIAKTSAPAPDAGINATGAAVPPRLTFTHLLVALLATALIAAAGGWFAATWRNA